MSRVVVRKGKRWVARPDKLQYIKRLSLSTVAVLVFLLGLEGRRLAYSAAAASAGNSPQASRIHCVSWRQTLSCSPYGCAALCRLSDSPQSLSLSQINPLKKSVHSGCRQLQRDLGCLHRITQGSGYCECSGGWTVNRWLSLQNQAKTLACFLIAKRALTLKSPADLVVGTVQPSPVRRHVTG